MSLKLYSTCISVLQNFGFFFRPPPKLPKFAKFCRNFEPCPVQQWTHLPIATATLYLLQFLFEASDDYLSIATSCFLSLRILCFKVGQLISNNCSKYNINIISPLLKISPNEVCSIAGTFQLFSLFALTRSRRAL